MPRKGCAQPSPSDRMWRWQGKPLLDAFQTARGLRQSRRGNGAILMSTEAPEMPVRYPLFTSDGQALNWSLLYVPGAETLGALASALGGAVS